MGTCFLYGNGGGGSDLNFKVVGGTTQPENPKENTIWVNTDTEITGWAFSATEPESPEDGMVWIMTEATGSVNANLLKKNAVTVFLTSAIQYIGGSWVNKAAYIYRGASWVQFSSGLIYLYNTGDQCTNITGGWTVFNYSSSSTTRLSTDCIIGDYNDTSGAHAVVKTNNKIKFPYGNFKTLKILIDVTNQINASAYPNRFGLYTLSGVNTGDGSGFERQILCSTIATGKVYSLDVSSANGYFYVAWLNVGKGKVHKIWLE